MLIIISVLMSRFTHELIQGDSPVITVCILRQQLLTDIQQKRLCNSFVRCFKMYDHTQLLNAYYDFDTFYLPNTFSVRKTL